METPTPPQVNSPTPPQVNSTTPLQGNSVCEMTPSKGNSNKHTGPPPMEENFHYDLTLLESPRSSTALKAEARERFDGYLSGRRVDPLLEVYVDRKILAQALQYDEGSVLCGRMVNAYRRVHASCSGTQTTNDKAPSTTNSGTQTTNDESQTTLSAFRRKIGSCGG
jgi:hypothetical protein